MQTLSIGSTLQNGKYKIKKVLGQGGFGITYLAEQDMLDRQVAIKEFFFREYCDRNGHTGNVILGIHTNEETVERFLQKFIKEAKTISRLHHPGIIEIYDIFKENNTAYYVMEYIEGESLGNLVERDGALSEREALSYIREVADVLEYIHALNINHLDIKPNNLMLRSRDSKVIVIDFGVSKQYDENTNEGTTTTPVGISHGYSPSEQYMVNGVSKFSPQSDIYSLGATLYKLVTGDTPPEALKVAQEGLPTIRAALSSNVKQAILESMQFRKENRPQTIAAFIGILDGNGNTSQIIYPSSATKTEEDEDTRIIGHYNEPHDDINIEQYSSKKSSTSSNKILIFTTIIVLAVSLLLLKIWHDSEGGTPHEPQGELSGDIAKHDSINSTKTETPSEITYNKGCLRFNGKQYKMINITGGTFIMGATSGIKESSHLEKPSHKVFLSDFSIGETEVPQDLWIAVMGYNPSYWKGDDLPVESVSWEHCQKFITKLNSLTGQNFRLPTEAEWEYAARGGNYSRHTVYSGSNNIDSVAWVRDNSGNQSHPVKQKCPNELGIYDMSGNVAERCQDWYAAYPYSGQTNPVGPSTGKNRIFRGGSWFNIATCSRTLFRSYGQTDKASNFIGLRLALSK